MGLMSPAEYVQSLRDGRVTFRDGGRIDDLTAHPRFKIASPTPRPTRRATSRSAAACSPRTALSVAGAH